MQLALPARQTSRGVARIGREPLFLAAPSRVFSAPRTLDVPLPRAQAGQGRQVTPQAQEEPAAARRAFANAARESEALYGRILAGAAQIAREADADLTELTDRAESELGRALAQLEEDLAQRRLDAANRRDFALDRIASRTDLLRFYVVEQANGALGRMAALRRELLGEIERIRRPTRPAIAALTTARDDAYDAANRAHFAIQELEGDPGTKLATASLFQVQERERGPMLVAAMLEAAEHYGPPRFATDDQLLADRLGVVSNFADPLLACTKCEIDAKVYAIEMHAENLGVAGPRALRSARDSTLRSIDKAEQRLLLTVREAHRATDGALLDRHEQTRGLVVAQAGQAMLAMRRDVEGSGERLVEALGSVAATQPSALSMVHNEIEKAAALTPTRAASIGVRASERLLRNTRSAAQRHPSTLLDRAERNQTLRVGRTAAAGRDQKALVGGFNAQEVRLVSDSFDQVAQSVDESLFGMAGMPGQVGKTCDSMLRTAREALTEVQRTTQDEIDFIVSKLNDACEGLMPPPPSGTTTTGTDSGHAPAPEPLMCTPGDAPNMSVFDPGALSSSMSSSSPLMSMAPTSSPLMSMAPPPMSSSSATAPGSSTAPPPRTGGAAAGPASCGTCDSARSAARGPAGPEGNATSTSSTGSGTSGEATGAPAPASDAGDDVGVCSDRTEMRSPRAFKAHCEPIAANALTAPTTAEFITTVHNNLTQMLDARVEIAHAALQRTGETDYGKLFKDCLRGLTRIQGQAFTERYRKAHHRDLASEIRAHAHDSLFTAASTDIYNSEAAVAALEGRAVDAAMNELRAAFNYSNETGRIFEIMQSLSQDQMAELLHTHDTELRQLMDQLSDSDKARFDLLMNGRTVRARSTELKGTVDQANSRFRTGRDSDRRGFALGDAIAEAENPAQGRWGLEGAADRVDVFGLEDPGVRHAREQRHWREIQEDFINLDGVADEIARANPDAARSSPDDPPGAALLAYATRPLTYRVYSPYQQAGETREQALDRQAREEARYGVTLGAEDRDQYGHVGRTATTTLSEYQQLYLEMAVIRGSQSREARAARALAQFRRRDGRPPDYDDMEKSLRSGLGDAREMGNFEHAPAHEVDRDRLQTFVMMERFRRQIEGGATGPISGTDARAMFRSEMEAAYRDRPDDLDVALGVIDSDAGNMQAVIDQAIKRENPALLNRYLGRMDSNQIEEVVTEWNRRHPGGPGLREKLGVGRGNHWSIINWNGAVFTGDEANALEIAMMGVPQTPLQKAEVQHRVIQQQIEQAGWLGKLLCSDEYDAMVANARQLRQVMGVTESQFDDNGRVIVTDPQTGERIKFNFDSSGRFVPARDGDATLFQSLLGTSRILAENYTAATDRMASFITTGIAIIVGAILSVATLGMGTAFAIALVAGALTIAVNASMRGGRYSRDDFTRDLVSAAVQAVTAGIGAGMSNVGRAAQAAKAAELAGKVGATAQFARGLGTTQRLLLAATQRPIVTQAAMGAFSSGVSTALDPAMRRREDYGDQVWNAIFRGGAGGAVTAGVMHGMTSGANALAQRYAASRAMAYALQRGASSEAAMRYAARASLAVLRGRTLEVGWRTVAGATAGMLGRGTEMAYDNQFAGGRHTSEDFLREMRNAFAHSAAQNFLEGAGSRYKRLYNAGGIEEDRVNRRLQAGEARDYAERAFEREAARSGTASDGSEAVPGGRPPTSGARPAEGDEGPVVRTADEENRRRQVAAANDNPPVAGGGPVRTRAALAEGEMLRMGRVDEGSIFIHPESKNLQAANDNFTMLVNADPTREVAIYHNPLTGEYLVIQGGPKSVAVIRHDGEVMGPGVTGYPAYALAERGGHWQLRSHFHPNRPGQRFTNMARRLPSGADGDFGVLEAEARYLAMTSGNGVAERTSRIYFVDKGQLRFTDFTVRVDNGRVTYGVNFPRSLFGFSWQSGPHSFNNIREYYRFFERHAGFPYPRAGGAARGRTADGPPAPAPLDAARRVGGEAARLGDVLTSQNRTDAEFAAQRMGQAESFEAARLAGRPHDSGIDPLIGRLATTADAHTIVADMGLVDRPDAMRRLAAVINDPVLSNSVKEQVLVAVRNATREALIRRGALAPHEPFLLTLHGATNARAASIRQGGIDMSLVQYKATDDFSHALYFSTQLSNAQLYATRDGGSGFIFPGILRGRDMGMEVGPRATRPGAVIDVTPQGAHRAQWEAFVRANIGLMGQAEGYISPARRQRMIEIGRQVFDENPANAGKTPRPMELELLGMEHFHARAQFADLDRFGARSVLFDAFLAHMAATTGDARLGAPHIVLGELGGVLTSGIGRGDQQAIKSRGIVDLLNEQLGVGRSVRTSDEDVMVRAADRPSSAKERREAAARRRAEAEAEENRRYWASFERAFERMAQDSPKIKDLQENLAQARAESAPPAVPQLVLVEGLKLINATIEGARRGNSYEAGLLNDLLNSAPVATRRILFEIAIDGFADRPRMLSISDIMAIEAEIRSNPNNTQAQAARAWYFNDIADAGTALHRILSEVIATSTSAIDTQLAQTFAPEATARAALRAIRQFGNGRSPTEERQEIYRLRQLDSEGLVEMALSDGNLHSRAMRFAGRLMRAGIDPAQAITDAFLAAKILRGADFQETHDRWQQRLVGITPQLLGQVVRERPDALLHLSKANPRQLSEWFADYILRQPRKAGVTINADEFADYVANRLISNVLPIGSEAASVWDNMKRLGLTLLKADAVQRGGANRPGLDIVGFSGPDNMRLTPGRKVRVAVLDDKAYRGSELDSVSAMTDLRLAKNLRTTAAEIGDSLRALQRVAAATGNTELLDFIAGARAAMRQMRKAARELDRIRPADAELMRQEPYLSQVADILRRNNIVPLISSKHGNVTALAAWLRLQGFMLDDEYAKVLADRLKRMQ